MKFKVKKNRRGEWFWHIVARNGKTVTTSGEPFHSKGNAQRALRAFIRGVLGAWDKRNGDIEVLIEE